MLYGTNLPPDTKFINPQQRSGITSHERDKAINAVARLLEKAETKEHGDTLGNTFLGIGTKSLVVQQELEEGMHFILVTPQNIMFAVHDKKEDPNFVEAMQVDVQGLSPVFEANWAEMGDAPKWGLIVSPQVMKGDAATLGAALSQAAQCITLASQPQEKSPVAAEVAEPMPT